MFELGVNTSTVRRALRVTAVLQQARELLETARRHRYRREELLRMIQSLP
jgi:hypothetical protein